MAAKMQNLGIAVLLFGLHFKLHCAIMYQKMGAYANIVEQRMYKEKHMYAKFLNE